VSQGSGKPDTALYNDSESFSSNENLSRSNGTNVSKYANGSQREKERHSTNGNHQPQHQPTVLEQLPAAHMNELDDYLDMLYQVGGKTEKEKDVGLKMQERCVALLIQYLFRLLFILSRGTAMILKLCRDVMNLVSTFCNTGVILYNSLD